MFTLYGASKARNQGSSLPVMCLECKYTVLGMVYRTVYRCQFYALYIYDIGHMVSTPKLSHLSASIIEIWGETGDAASLKCMITTESHRLDANSQPLYYVSLVFNDCHSRLLRIAWDIQFKDYILS